MEMNAQFDFAAIEKKWYQHSLDNKLFAAVPDSTKQPYTIVIPPPNVTGILHMGHALNNTIQDVYVRYKRMQGYSSCWMPGTDHAGIATQNVVERKLAKEGKRKEDIGRESFTKELWAWKNHSGSTIIEQLKRLGASCDWDRTRFTMDGQYSESVREVFVSLFEQGLVYKGNRIVNWCPRCLTALSDEEAEHNESDGHLWFLRYPVTKKGTPSDPDYIVVATTRPETMFGDTGLAINPTDERYRWMKNAEITLPLVNRKLTVIEDELIDPAFGTGIVKVTPAHDPNDFVMGKKHGLESVVIMHADGRMNEGAIGFDGMDRFACREALVEKLKGMDLIEKIDPYKLNARYCYRCHTVVESRLSPQWFVNMKPLAEKAITVVKNGEVKFTPERWEKVYLNWMENIQDWCISRQIWWGHRIPVWYCADCQEKGLEGAYASRTDMTSCPTCGSHKLTQETDVLDTWFSSWLWPFATFGWPFRAPAVPASTPECPRTPDFDVQRADLAYFYPTNMLATASEILFFWVARMIMAGMHFVGKSPFSDVYIHGTVRDDKGVKMSKSLGNTIDPIEIIEKFGTDSLRFSLMMLCAAGSDVYLNDDKFLLGRNFCNKIWNATKFTLSSIDMSQVKDSLDGLELTDADRWMLSETDVLIAKATENLDKYRINDCTKETYDFFWTKFCDWYIEISKVEKTPAKATIMVYVLRTVMKLLHPVMPFITDEIYSLIKPKGTTDSIVTAPWPVVSGLSFGDTASMVKLQELVAIIRSFKKDLGIADKIEVAIEGSDAAKKAVEANKAWICLTARISDIRTTKFSEACVENATLDYTIFVRKEGIEGLDDVKVKIAKRKKELLGFIAGGEKKLENKAFVDKAPPAIIEGAKAQIAQNKTELTQLEKIKFD